MSEAGPDGRPEGIDQAEEARGREPIFNMPAVVVWLIAACVGVHLARLYLLDQAQDLQLILRLAFIPERYSGRYLIDIWAFVSPFSYAFLHGGFAHLAVNVIWLAAFGSPLANRIGAGRFLLFWAFTSLAAVGLHYVLHPLDQAPLVGASGAISGMMGAAARFGFRIDRSKGKGAFAGRILSIPEVFSSRMALTFLAVWMAVNLLAGFGFGTPGGDARIAWEAHIGGFLAGFLAVRLFDRKAGMSEPPTRGGSV
ncbi:rhomboid family intramembrane serine protease [Aquamicrobium sp. LC103]|uniref:rhomboid family intramembrane serine protease n=1 Tax=Aquamicrobium sp. LC103 TaxID=1120658 RepID=UPI00063EB7BB|nr:rhomboid family intramembrane serine protease [Aquamicrobium sp. LC103]TKT79192.1 rhomboid family intramembrane serine protease [Aquamicrobium sp. LC103]